MRLGKVKFELSLVVDLDNQEMVDYAKDCIYADLLDIFQYNTADKNMSLQEDSSLKESDIPDFVKEMFEKEG